MTQKVVVRQSSEAIALLEALQRQLAGEEAQGGVPGWFGLPSKSAIVEAAIWHWLHSAQSGQRRKAFDAVSKGETTPRTFYLVHPTSLNEACGVLGVERARRGETFPTRGRTLEAVIRAFFEAGPAARGCARRMVQGILGPMDIGDESVRWRATRDAEQVDAKD
ncbi:MAG: hypothetical protein OXT64_01305 [Gammaproteobacteria bacterium]|nr:hypothetical protein [Gammaproteobacteria bacterium]